MGVNCSAGLCVCREVYIWLGALKSSITSICPFSFTLSFLYEQKKAKCGPKSLVSPRQVKPLLPGARSGHQKISAASSSVLVRPLPVTINTGSVLAPVSQETHPMERLFLCLVTEMRWGKTVPTLYFTSEFVGFFFPCNEFSQNYSISSVKRCLLHFMGVS